MENIAPISAQIESPEPWKTTLLAGLANYVDAGSIVACSAALTLWVQEYRLAPEFVGLLGAIGANAIGGGVGALIGGRLCDQFGRKRIFQWDMVFYAFGMAWLVFATAPWALIVGSILVGLAVGADIPASWSLIAETAPQARRGKYGGIAQAFWALGPMVVLLMFVVLLPLGLLGARLVFIHLAFVGVLLTILRSRMRESQLWEVAKAGQSAADNANGQSFSAGRIRGMFSPPHLGAIVFLIGFYGIWNLFAGINSFYFQYMLTSVGGQTPLTGLVLRGALGFVFLASLYLIFMRLSDRANQRKIIIISSTIQVIGVSLLALFPLTTGLLIVYGLLLSFSNAFGQQPFYQLWSAELFPTLLRGTAQGFTFAVVRIGLGAWSFIVPTLMATRFETLMWIMVGFLVVSGSIGVIWTPRNEGKSLREIQEHRERSLRRC